MPARILVVDDEPDLRTLYELTLLREGHSVSSAADLAEAREIIEREHFDVLITDMRLPDGLGLELLRELAQAQRPEKSIVITAYGSAENAVEALKSGAFDYLTKPVDLRQLRAAVAAAQQSQRRLPVCALPGADALATVLATAPPPPGGIRALARIAGSSEAMTRIKSRIEKVATSMAPVLILGESGTGKELVARAVHECSHRAAGPFVAVNCGAIPDNLIEAEFFGARKGAYTGAHHDREGYFQAASGGTLFLDEVGDIPLPMQVKLLRLLETGTYRRVGSTELRHADIRVVAATHRDLDRMMADGRFREDLYYRLCTFPIALPPLREREGDIALLAPALLERVAAPRRLQLSASAMALLQVQPFPGNVRELRNLLERAALLCDGDVVDATHVEEAIATGRRPGRAPAAPPLPRSPAGTTDLRSLERDTLRALVAAHTGKRAELAARLGVSERTLYRKLRQLKLD